MQSIINNPIHVSLTELSKQTELAAQTYLPSYVYVGYNFTNQLSGILTILKLLFQ